MLKSIFLAIALCVPLHVFAKDTTHHTKLSSMELAEPWYAVGRLDLGNGFCTATLINPRQVLTAAHCLYDRSSKKMRDPANITFRAGYRNGRAIETRKARRYRAYDTYDATAPSSFEKWPMTLRS